MNKPNPNIFVSLDLEMAQPSGRIIQIGACFFNNETGEILERLCLAVNPHEQLTPFIIGLTGITQADVDSGLELREAYNRLSETFKTHNTFRNPVVWGNGDSETLRAQLNLDQETYLFGRRCIDVKTIWIAFRIATNLPFKGGLARCMTKIGLNFKGRKHNALDDAENTAILFRRLQEELRNAKTTFKC